MANTRKRTLGRAERAVYDLVRIGGLNATHAAIYRRELNALSAAGLVLRGAEGRYADAAVEPDASPPPKVTKTGTLIVRVPVDVIAALDAEGPTRAEAARRLLTAVLEAESGESGTRRKS